MVPDLLLSYLTQSQKKYRKKLRWKTIKPRAWINRTNLINDTKEYLLGDVDLYKKETKTNTSQRYVKNIKNSLITWKHKTEAKYNNVDKY